MPPPDFSTRTRVCRPGLQGHFSLGVAAKASEQEEGKPRLTRPSQLPKRDTAFVPLHEPVRGALSGSRGAARQDQGPLGLGVASARALGADRGKGTRRLHRQPGLRRCKGLLLQRLVGGRVRRGDEGRVRLQQHRLQRHHHGVPCFVQLLPGQYSRRRRSDLPRRRQVGQVPSPQLLGNDGAAALDAAHALADEARRRLFDHGLRLRRPA